LTDRVVTAGQTATFSVAAAGTPPLTYQWKWNGETIPGATSSSFTTPVTTIADNGTRFSVVVSNVADSVTSNTATLTVNAPILPPTFTTRPTGRTITSGKTASFTVVASGTAPLTYQWKKNGVDIPGATASAYTTPEATTADNGARFTVAVNNAAGSAVSNAA